MSDLENENITDLEMLDELDDICKWLFVTCRYVYREYGKSEDYIDEEVEMEMAKWLFYEVLQRKPTVIGKREFISQAQFLEDFFVFNDFIRTINPKRKELKQLKALCIQSDYVYVKNIQKKMFDLKSKINRFYSHYVDEIMQMDIETEILYMVLFSVWLNNFKNIPEDAQRIYNGLYSNNMLDELKQMHEDLCLFRKNSIKNGKNNFFMRSVLVWTIKCCAGLNFMDENEFIITRYGVQLFLKRFRFTESIVKVELSDVLVDIWNNTEQILNVADPGELILRLNQFMEEQRTPIVGKWSKEQEERYYGRGRFMSVDTRPLMQLVRGYFGKGFEEMITNDYFTGVKSSDTSDDVTRMEQELLQLQHLYYNRFVAVVFLCFNPLPDSFLAVSELLWLLSFLLEWMENKGADTIIIMMLQKIKEAKEFILASEKIIDDVMDIFINYIISQKIELDDIKHEILMTDILFHQFQKLD